MGDKLHAGGDRTGIVDAAKGSHVIYLCGKVRGNCGPPRCAVAGLAIASAARMVRAQSSRSTGTALGEFVCPGAWPGRPAGIFGATRPTSWPSQVMMERPARP